MPRQHAFVRGSDLGPRSNRPTFDNTGPNPALTLTEMTAAAALAAGGATGKLITTGVEMNSAHYAQTYNFTDCILDWGLSFGAVGGGAQVPLANMPIVNLTRCKLNSPVYLINGLKLTMDYCSTTSTHQSQGVAGVNQWTMKDNVNDATGPLPVVASNTLFYCPREPTGSGAHTEAVHTFEHATGMGFTNCAFVQEGPINGTQTGAINFAGDGTVFDSCWFHYANGKGANYTVYMGGTNLLLRDCKIELGTSGYVYPTPTFGHAVYTGCTDYETGAALTLPPT